jgi:hypothetical protein
MKEHTVSAFRSEEFADQNKDQVLSEVIVRTCYQTTRHHIPLLMKR